MKKYNQLNLGQRYQIECFLELGYNQTEIANKIGCNKSTISRDLKHNITKRGRGACRSRVELSQRKADLRVTNKNKAKLFTSKMKRFIRKLLKEQSWSPELISEKGK